MVRVKAGALESSQCPVSKTLPIELVVRGQFWSFNISVSQLLRYLPSV